MDRQNVIADRVSLASVLRSLSAALDRKVEYVDMPGFLPDNGFPAEEEVERRGVAARIAPDGAVLVYVDLERKDPGSGRPLPVSEDAVKGNVVFHLAMEEGLKAFLPNMAAMRRVASHCGAMTSVMKDEDVRALLESCAYAMKRPSVRGIAEKIVGYAFGEPVPPSFLVGTLIDGLIVNRRKRVSLLRGDCGLERRVFAKESLSPYSDHNHVHLGSVTGGFRALGYPDCEAYVDCKDIHRLAEELACSTDELIDGGLLEEMSDPMCILTSPTRDEDYYMAVLNIKNAAGEYAYMTVPSAHQAMEWRVRSNDGSVQENATGGFRVVGFKFVSPQRLSKMLSYVSFDTHALANIRYLRPAPGQVPVPGRPCPYAVVGELLRLGEEEKKAVPEESQERSHKLQSPGTYNHTANIISSFKYPKPSEEKMQVSAQRTGRRAKRRARAAQAAAHTPAELAFHAAVSAVKADGHADVLAPVLSEGHMVSGADACHLLALMAVKDTWESCNVFVTKEDLDGLGIGLRRDAEGIDLFGMPDCTVYNAMDMDVTSEVRDALALHCIDAGEPVFPGVFGMIAEGVSEDVSLTLASRKKMDENYRYYVGGSVRQIPLSGMLKAIAAAMEKKYDRDGLMRDFGFPETVRRHLMLTGAVRYEGGLYAHRVRGGGESTFVPKEEVDVTLALTPEGIHIKDAYGDDKGSLRSVFLVKEPAFAALRPVKDKDEGNGAAKLLDKEITDDIDHHR